MKNSVKKICFVGVGSIAKRHILNLVKLSEAYEFILEIHAFRHQDGALLYPELEKYIQFTHHETTLLSGMKFDAVFITNPTALHFASINELAPYANNFFIEKPIFEDCHYDLSELMISPKAKCYVAAPMRFTEMFAFIKSYINDNNPISVRIICSDYMPNWQKGRDYRKSFRTKATMGGGVDIDLIHEIDYMVGLFGFPQRTLHAVGHYSNLEMETCDLATYIFEYKNMLAEVHLDYFGVEAKREIEIYFNNEKLIVDFFEKSVKFISTGEKRYFNNEYDHYYNEMEYFLELIDSDIQNINPVDYAYNVLKIIKGGKKI